MTSKLQILGLRILRYNQTIKKYVIEYEFIGDDWKYNAWQIVPNYLDLSDIMFQTLYSFSSSHNIISGYISKPSQIWLNNFNFRINNLLK